MRQFKKGLMHPMVNVYITMENIGKSQTHYQVSEIFAAGDLYLGVAINGGTSKWMVYDGKSSEKNR